MKRPRLLDLYCGAGGAAEGYYRAGFDVIGVDIRPQPNYPFEFYQRNALAWLDFGPRLADDFDAIHASPPCQDHSKMRNLHPGRHGTGRLVYDTRMSLIRTGLPWIIENVPGAPLRPDYALCGCMFGLPGLRRKRIFETSWYGVPLPPECAHSDDDPMTVTVAGHTGGRDGKPGRAPLEKWEAAMGIRWMTASELAQAIPPAYTEYVGTQLMSTLRRETV